jgi:hypothetical protein
MIAVESTVNRASTPKRESLEPNSIEHGSLALVIRDKTSSNTPSIETIYKQAAIENSPLGYNILRVAEMADSPHLSGMPEEARRSAILMALETAGVDLNFLVADAISRHRALNDYEDALLNELQAFEAEKAHEAAAAQAELDRLTAQCRSRIQAGLEEVAREQTAFHAWQKRRQKESQRVVDTAMLLVPRDNTSGGDSLAALLDRATACRK